MGLLTVGEPMEWPELCSHSAYIRTHGAAQFVNRVAQCSDITFSPFLWGDEVEYHVVKFDHESKTVHLSLRGSRLVKLLENDENIWQPEFGEFMIESCPREPYGKDGSLFSNVEENMRQRRNAVMKLLNSDESIMTMSVFPRLGCRNFTDPPLVPDKCSVSGSEYFPESAISTHPRYKFLLENPVRRRGDKMSIDIPFFRESLDTTNGYHSLNPLNHRENGSVNVSEEFIHGDSVGFGFACNALQATLQAATLHEARLIYDQLIPLCPIMAALSASTCAIRGYLSDIDVRLPLLFQALDDRTTEELDPQSNKKIVRRSPATTSHYYISPLAESYNDVPIVYNTGVFNQLQNQGIDKQLSRYMAHLFVRDAIVGYKHKIHVNDQTSIEHFENINSTNWQTMRFKIPEPEKNLGWRVEFRPLETQTTDFENAAYVVFVVILSRAILKFGLNLCLPMSKVELNMENCIKRDAVLDQEFYFCRNIEKGKNGTHAEYTKMTINEIINGQQNGGFPGLVPYIHRYIDSSDFDSKTRLLLSRYINLISKRASGAINTTAHAVRHFFMNHPDYKHDSVVSDRMTYDLYMKIHSGELSFL